MKTKIILYIIGIFLFCKINIAQEYPCGMPSPILRYNVPTNISGGYSDVEIMIYNQTQYFPPLLVFQKVCYLYLNSSKHFVQTFWSPTALSEEGHSRL
jgi:hypothetical protein